MKRLKRLALLITLSLLSGCLDAEPLGPFGADQEWVPYAMRLPDGRLASGIGLRSGDKVIVGGDIIIPASSSAGQHTQSAYGAANLWPNRVIPYAIDPQLDAATRQKVISAMTPWTQIGFAFRQRTTESPFVWITTKAPGFQDWGCAATVGFQNPNTSPELYGNAYYAGSECRTHDYVHEWGHIIGLFHEHVRNDRDQYITVYRFDPGFEVGRYEGTDLGAYDFDSIMHYDAYGRNPNGTIDYGDVVIRPKDGRSLNSFGFTEVPSSGDIVAVDGMYWNESQWR